MKKLINKYSTFVALILLVGASGGIVTKGGPTTAPASPMPLNPNGFDDLVTAGHKIHYASLSIGMRYRECK